MCSARLRPIVIGPSEGRPCGCGALSACPALPVSPAWLVCPAAFGVSPWSGSTSAKANVSGARSVAVGTRFTAEPSM